MLRFCQILVEIKFHNSYRFVSRPTLRKYKRIHQHLFHLKETKSSVSVRSRSCQIQKENGKVEIFVAPISVASLNNVDEPYEAKDTVVVLSCLKEWCTLEGTLEVPNLEDNFPILGKFNRVLCLHIVSLNLKFTVINSKE